MIELVVTIAILGILAAVAVPRFVGLAGSAQQANFEAIAGAFEEGVALTHTVWLAGGMFSATTVAVENGTVDVNGDGWPVLDAAVPGQMTGLELYETIMLTELPSTWTTDEDTAAGWADFIYEGMTFRYDANSGAVRITVP